MSNTRYFQPQPRRPHQGRDRFFAAVFIAMVVLGVVSLYYSLSLVSLLILIGLIVLVLSIGSLAGSMRGGPERDG